MPQPTIAVIGAGFSGTALSLWLQSSCPVGTRIHLIERGHRFASGRAYATENPSHLLNVPAGRMSMFPDLPQDFVRWLRQQPKSRLGHVVPDEQAFVPRSLFGAYLQDRLAASLSDTRASRLELLHDEVVRAEEGAAKVTLHLASGAKLDADIAVLASGNAHPLPVHPNVAMLDAAGLWRGNPWTPAVLAGLAPDAPVLLVGTGLTMVDTVVTLLEAGHTGPIHALSRHGLLPHRHASPELAPITLPTSLSHWACADHARCQERNRTVTGSRDRLAPRDRRVASVHPGPLARPERQRTRALPAPPARVLGRASPPHRTHGR